ncbi:MAG TPA: DUF4230 domain-containing protein [Actinomycetes bacterium]|jgi:hypothetical protein|nr:DUF4230 domain-containing protein [Actinomycetes bacterium]
MSTERYEPGAGRGAGVDHPTVPLGQPDEGRPRGRRRRLPRLPGRALAALVVLAVLLLAASRLTDLRLWPSLPNPLAPRRVDRSQPVLLKQMVDLKVYKAASGNFQEIIDLEKGTKLVPLFLRGERTLFVAAGSVDAEVDFSGIDKGAIKVSPDGRSASITLPHARLTPARIDPDRSYVASRQRGVLDRLGSVLSDNPTSERELYQLASQRLEAAAAASGLVERAEQNTRTMLVSMLRSLGYRDVTVTFQNPPS